MIVGIWAGVALIGLIGWYAYQLPPLGDLPALERRPAVQLLALDGTPFARFGDARDGVSIGDLPPHVPQAVLAIEDARFYSHFGIDPVGIGRAALVNLRAGRIRQGGSTITQQLAKTLFLGPERSLRRKMQELILAFWLEARFTKDEILGLYLNRVYFGAGHFGIESAARGYFGKPASALQVNEAALLAGLLKAPSRLSPTRNPDQAAARAEVVLGRMAALGFLKPAEARIITANPARLGPQQSGVGRHFADWAMDELRGHVGRGMAEGDLVVQTTLDLRLQRLAEREVAGIRAAAEARNASQIAMVILSPDGAVRAMVGGTDYASSPFNRAVRALRQPGSAFKPFVFLAGLEAGYDPESVWEDAPVRIGDFAPRNYDNRFRGPVTMSEALAHSLNTVAVRIQHQAGIDSVLRWARRLGITSDLRREAGLALGASEVSLADMTQAYAAFANGGRAVFAHGVHEIRDEAGGLVFSRSGSGPGGRIPPEILEPLNRMMAKAITDGTGRAADIGMPSGGKTGTTQNHRDAWFIGYTAHLVAGVWMGNDDGRPMEGVTGGSLPAELWRGVMEAAHDRHPSEPLPGTRGSGFWRRLIGG